MERPYLEIDKIGFLNGIKVKALYLKKLSAIDQKYPCAKCHFHGDPFNCCFQIKIRPACCSGDKENISKQPIYYVKV